MGPQETQRSLGNPPLVDPTAPARHGSRGGCTLLNSDETYNKNFRVYDSSSSTELGSTIVNNGYLQMHTGFSVMACGISESAASTIDIQWEAQNAGDTSSTGSTGVWTVYAWYE